ncbi:MAG: isoprenylcysteine carboxylmethyltransferase family protein [Spirochaetes bacterium]|jgi:protein-S-isoprenylcysteine O-methyltransferase Ste14|nr:isoprenylcysteine carboxylmethyltransferase family protein [Spirochaetota bacterium]
MNKAKNYILLYTTLILGAGSLIPFYAFLFFGPFNLVDLGLQKDQALVVDAALCLLFFLQHSIIVRKGMRGKLRDLVPADYYGAFYSITSSIPLALMIIFWQTADAFLSAEGAWYWALRFMFILGMAGFYWGIKSLGFFDPFGTLNIRRLISGKPRKIPPLTAKGPYLWVRHPLYFFSLIMIWANPHLSQDRLLFNIMWTGWIIIGTILEERDLVADFGDGYRDYQKRVPMLIPYKGPVKQG